MPLKSEHEIYRLTGDRTLAPPTDRPGLCALCLSQLSLPGRLHLRILTAKFNASILIRYWVVAESNVNGPF